MFVCVNAWFCVCFGMRFCAVFVVYGVMVYGMFVCFVFVCMLVFTVFVWYVCTVWRDGLVLVLCVVFNVCVCVRCCCRLTCLGDVVMLYCVKLYGLLCVGSNYVFVCGSLVYECGCVLVCGLLSDVVCCLCVCVCLNACALLWCMA